MARLSQIYVAVVMLALTGALSGRLQAQAISTVSPFLPQNGAAGAVTDNSPIELRGILAIPGGSLFGLYDPVRKQGGWVKLNEAGRDFTVRTYDVANDAVTVEYQGRVLSLALKSSKIESMPAMAVVQPPRAVPGPQLASAPTVDEAKRLEAVAAEVARRRQQRQAAMQQQQQMPAPQNAPPHQR